MNNNLYSNIEFRQLIDDINHEMKRRGTYSWWDPLVAPTVGEDRTTPLSIPEDDGKYQVDVDDRTYTINNPSTGSIEETRNAVMESHGYNPAGQLPDPTTNVPNTSVAQLNLDELKNLLVGLSKIEDINLFYGRDEILNLAFRDPTGIEDVLVRAQESELHRPLKESDIEPTIFDNRNGVLVTHDIEDGEYVMRTGQYDGDQGEPDENNFFDDHGAMPGDGDFTPYNPGNMTINDVTYTEQDNDRNEIEINTYTTTAVDRFGRNPRNPVVGNEGAPRPVYGGVKTSCNAACTGLCYQTCDSHCSESCTTTCFNRCGEACTAACGNSCTSCSSMCAGSCDTRCEDTAGYSCLNAGAETVMIETIGGSHGIAAENRIRTTYHSCNGCSFTCQFYPNKKTTCWDSNCMGTCFTSCQFYCSSSCFGGCIANASENDGTFKGGIGEGCKNSCTINCVGSCDGVCEGFCISYCYHACQQQCSDNCSWDCSTGCGYGCDNGCTQGCTGCASCAGSCQGDANAVTCTGCGIIGGCTSQCQHDCNSNCIGFGCKSLCGVNDGAGACEANCRMNCTGTSCTSMCSDACSGECSSCVNTCGYQCGACSGLCSTGCESACNINCSAVCAHSCDTNCLTSCSDNCGGCSTLCYSCVGMCIGTCAVRCEHTCSSCVGNCSFWCDTSCSRDCMANCSTFCVSTCSGNCSTGLNSETTFTSGPERGPTAENYIYKEPQNRWEERESFKLFVDPGPPVITPVEPKPIVVGLTLYDLDVYCTHPDNLTYAVYQSTISGGVYDIHADGSFTVNLNQVGAVIDAIDWNSDGDNSVYIFVIKYVHNDGDTYTTDDIGFENIPFGYHGIDPVYREEYNDFVCIITRDPFYVY